MLTLFISIGLLIIGEGLNVLAELYAAKIPPTSLFKPESLILFVMVFFGCSFLLLGYSVGFSVSKNIWIVTASSIAAILIVEPALAYMFFQQLPEKGALLGLILGATGLVATVAWR